MSDALRRGLRGLAQTTFVAIIIAILASFEIIHWTEQQTSLVMMGATFIVTFVQNVLEDNGTIPSVGKSPASAGANPVDTTQRLEPH